MSIELNRRSFLKGATLGIAGVGALGVLSSCTPDEASRSAGANDVLPTTGWRIAPEQVPEEKITFEENADYVIVGMGYAGTCVARVLAEAGIKVIAIEAQTEDAYAVAGQDFGHINSQFLANNGVPEVDVIEYFNNWMRQTLNIANPDLIMKYSNECGTTFDWYIEPLGDGFISTIKLDYWPTNDFMLPEVNGQKFYTGTPQFLERTLSDAQKIHHQNYVAAGGVLYYATSAEQLIEEGERVAGVIAKDADDQYVRFTADKAVVLAAGDFGNNLEMCKDLMPHIADTVNDESEWFSTGRDGRGIQLGVWAGGRIEPRPLPAMEVPVVPFAPFMPMNSLWLDYQGKRFCNEFFGDMAWMHRSLVNMHREKICTVNDSEFSNQVFNISSHCRFDPTDPAQIEGLKAMMARAVEAGNEGVIREMGNYTYTYYAADNLETLADYAGYEGDSKANFLSAISRYNESCRLGRDEDYGKDPRVLFALENPPYFISVQTVHNIGGVGVSVGGLLTTGDQQVLNEQYDPIEGLYATGNCCGRRFGYNYFTPVAGVSVGMAATLGRVLGNHLLSA